MEDSEDEYLEKYQVEYWKTAKSNSGCIPTENARRIARTIREGALDIIPGENHREFQEGNFIGYPSQNAYGNARNIIFEASADILKKSFKILEGIS